MTTRTGILMAAALTIAATGTAATGASAGTAMRDPQGLIEFSEISGDVRVLSSRGLVGDGIDVAILPQFSDTDGVVEVIDARGLFAPAASIALRAGTLSSPQGAIR